MKTLLALALILIGACSSLPKVLRGPVSRQELFPRGTYTHQVSISQKEMGNRTFTGAVKVEKDAIDVVGLSDFSTTIFSVHEDRKTKKIETEVSLAALKKHEDKIKLFYSVIREFLLLERDTTGTFPKEIEIISQKKKVQIQFLDFDKNEIPSRIKIDHPDFGVEVEVTSYDL